MSPTLYQQAVAAPSQLKYSWYLRYFFVCLSLFLHEHRKVQPLVSEKVVCALFCRLACLGPFGLTLKLSSDFVAAVTVPASFHALDLSSVSQENLQVQNGNCMFVF